VKVGDLVKFKMHPGIFIPDNAYLIIKDWHGAGVSLCGFPWNQVFNYSQLEVISENESR
tara:strand:- start:1777 stop:1953 length:177 start_codon:yes stop_codon:yes gene_type:complete